MIRDDNGRTVFFAELQRKYTTRRAEPRPYGPPMRSISTAIYRLRALPHGSHTDLRPLTVRRIRPSGASSARRSRTNHPARSFIIQRDYKIAVRAIPHMSPTESELMESGQGPATITRAGFDQVTPDSAAASTTPSGPTGSLRAAGTPHEYNVAGLRPDRDALNDKTPRRVVHGNGPRACSMVIETRFGHSFYADQHGAGSTYKPPGVGLRLPRRVLQR